MTHSRTRWRVLTAAAVLALVAPLAACGGGSHDTDPTSITVWTMESLPDRMKVTEQIAADFTKETGIKVDLVGIDETQAPQLLQSAALSGDMPDVAAAFPLGLVQEMNNLEMVDTKASEKVVQDLGEDTFQKKALTLMQDHGTQIGVPSDGWAQILVYRKDLFAKAGLAPPTDYASLESAAKKLTKDGHYGITLATDPKDVFTQQTFEALALGNDCQLVDDKGDITIQSPQCQKTFDLYDQLTKDAPQGAQTVDTTRASYFSGESAMTLWSTYLLDELAGLRDDALPSCPECKGDSTYLARNTGVVLNVAGPDGKNGGGSYGEISGFVPMDSGKSASAEKFIEYMMSTGYEKWLGMAPEGKFPMRTGTPDEPDKYTTAWAGMDAGVDRRAPLGTFYDPAMIDQLTHLGENVDRWALPEGQGSMLGQFTSQLPLAQAVSEMASGSETPQEAAKAVATASKDMVKE